MKYTAFNAQDSDIHESGLTLLEAQEIVAEKGTHWSIMSDQDFSDLRSTDPDNNTLESVVGSDGVERLSRSR